MIKKKTTEIVIETDEMLHMSFPPGAFSSWCAKCGAEVEMLLPETAAALLGATAREIYRRVEAGKVHFTESPEGILVCSRSLGEIDS